MDVVLPIASTLRNLNHPLRHRRRKGHRKFERNSAHLQAKWKDDTQSYGKNEFPIKFVNHF
jgi:hypothetical protein